MDSSPTPASQRRDPDGGRVAVPEIAELLHLQRPVAAVAAAGVVLLGLLVALVLPDVLPANALTGVGVGILALLAGIAVAVVFDGRDPVLRGPRHLRRDGHVVLARMAGPDAARHGAPVLAALERRLEGRDHLSVVLTGSGTDPSELAAALGRGAAAAGHTALVVDLRAAGAPGVADVGEGTVKLGEAAQLADDRPYAWIGAGADRTAAARAAAGVARRPPRDLELLLIVAPEAATHVPEVLAACERTILLVAADIQQRVMVAARIDALRRAGARPETVVVGGVRLADGEAPIDALARPFAGAEPVPDPGEPEVVPPSPAPPPTVPDEPDPDDPEPMAPPSPEPDAPPVVVPDPDTASLPVDGDRDESADAEPESVQQDAGATRRKGGGTGSFDPFAEPREPQAPVVPAPPASSAPSAVAPADDPEDRQRTRQARDDERQARDDEQRARDDEQRAALEDTGPIPPVFRTAAPSGETEVEGMADSDALVTAAALEQLLANREHFGS